MMGRRGNTTSDHAKERYGTQHKMQPSAKNASAIQHSGDSTPTIHAVADFIWVATLRGSWWLSRLLLGRVVAASSIMVASEDDRKHAAVFENIWNRQGNRKTVHEHFYRKTSLSIVGEIFCLGGYHPQVLLLGS